MTDAPGTCHLLGCPGKGIHPQHGIGTGKWEDYQDSKYCIGFPMLVVANGEMLAYCSLNGSWSNWPEEPLGPKEMAKLVDEHKDKCPNRKITT